MFYEIENFSFPVLLHKYERPSLLGNEIWKISQPFELIKFLFNRFTLVGNNNSAEHSVQKDNLRLVIITKHIYTQKRNDTIKLNTGRQKTTAAT